MSSKVDSTKQILKLLKEYNKIKGNVKKIKRNALNRLNKFIRIFMKIMTVNCSKMLENLKIVTLTGAIFYTVYNITVNGNQEYTKEMYQKFQNLLYLSKIKQSELTFDSKKTIGNFFESNFIFLIREVLILCGNYTKPKNIEKCGILIQFILLLIFEAAGDCDVITIDILEMISKKTEFIELDRYLGGFNILGRDIIEKNDSYSGSDSGSDSE